MVSERMAGAGAMLSGTVWGMTSGRMVKNR